MRIIGIVVATTLLGLVLGVVLVEPDIAGAYDGDAPRGVPATCQRSLCENAVWLRTPVMRRAVFRR
jgi:hypothetical protein